LGGFFYEPEYGAPVTKQRQTLPLLSRPTPPQPPPEQIKTSVAIAPDAISHA